MMKHFVGILVFVIVFSLTALFFYRGLPLTMGWFEKELPTCVEQGFGEGCENGSDKPIAPGKVNRVLNVAANNENAHIFDSWEVIDTDRVKYTSARLYTAHGVYTINIFPASVTYLYRPYGQEWSNYTWADHGMDGEVDFGLVSDIMDKEARRFDIDFKIGSEYKPLYQKLYDRHLSAMIAELDRR
jgi:hypothetical protein